MPIADSLLSLPPQLESACLQIDALAALLQCTDPDSWESLARPGPAGLAALLFRIGAEMRSGVEDLARTA
jgi:hypothetical protein